MGDNGCMALEVGDKVKSNDGREGTIIQLNPIWLAAMVLLHEGGPGACATSIDLNQLTVIDAYSDPA